VGTNNVNRDRIFQICFI